MKGVVALAIFFLVTGVLITTAITSILDLPIIFNVIGGFVTGLFAFPLAERILEG
jgi:hypothetical protein